MLLSSALADQSSGKHRRSLILASAAAFAKPSMGYLYAVVLIVFACRNLRGERLVSRALHAMPGILVVARDRYHSGGLLWPDRFDQYHPAAGRSGWPIESFATGSSATLDVSFGIRRAHRGLSTLSIFGLLDRRHAVLDRFRHSGNGLLLSGADGTSVDTRRNEIIATCAVLHIAFIALFSATNGDRSIMRTF